MADGIGISPILSMAQQLKNQGKPYRLVYCGRQRDTLAYVDEITAITQTPELYISAEGRRANLQELVNKQPQGTHIYACGPEKMLDELEVLAATYQLDLTFELFSSSSGILNPELEQPFEVELVDTGKTYHVPRDKTLLQVLLEHDIDIPNDCEEGLCGSCEVVVEYGEIEHRDKVLTAAERAANTRMISCCSRAKGTIKIKL